VEGYVAKISLGGCGLTGSFPADPSIFSFKRLKGVQITMSEGEQVRHMKGPLPSDLASCTTLQRLELYGNALSGGILMLANLANLNLLDLHFNHFSGKIPDLSKSADSLEYISLANNLLTGPIPGSFSSLSNLDTLGLAYNNLTGTLDFVNSLKALKVVHPDQLPFSDKLSCIRSVRLRRSSSCATTRSMAPCPPSHRPLQSSIWTTMSSPPFPPPCAIAHSPVLIPTLEVARRTGRPR
jgi:hypothetical protein